MNDDAVVTAINDLTRVTIALAGVGTKADAIRKLHALSIPPSRIAAILAMPLNQVTGTLSKDKKKNKSSEDDND